MKGKIYSIVGVLLVLIVGYFCIAPARSVSSANSFYRALEKHTLAVAMFYYSDKQTKKSNPALYEKIKDAKSAFKSISDVRLYKNADMSFIRANIAEKKLKGLLIDLGVSVGQEPVYALFKNSRIIKNGKTKGFLTNPQLRTFIDTNMSSDIEDYLDDKAERRARERERSDTRVYFGVGGGYPWYGAYPYHGGWGYPYGGCGYGGCGYGGRVGFGVSFGI